MTPQPIHFVLDEASFDVSLLPPNARTPRSPAFRQAVSAYFHNAYAALGGTVDVDFAEGRIGVSWRSAQADEDPMGGIVELLKAGKYADARPMLEALLPVQPDNLDVLYNLGMVYSDEGRLDEARSLLRRATKMAPEHTNSFVALGVAALRARDTDEAEGALTRAVELEPQNPYALRTLGTLLLTKGDALGAVGLLRQAVTQAPGDPIALLTLAQALIKTDLASHGSEADGLLKGVLSIAPHGEIAEKAKDERRRIAEQGFRERGGDGRRMDAVMYCLDALTKFEGMSRSELAPILMELAALGQKGLPVNDPTQTFRLRSLAGEFTALQVLCLMHVGIKQIDPGQGSGFDIDKEYEAAVAIHGGGQTEP